MQVAGKWLSKKKVIVASLALLAVVFIGVSVADYFSHPKILVESGACGEYIDANKVASILGGVVVGVDYASSACRISLNLPDFSSDTSVVEITYIRKSTEKEAEEFFEDMRSSAIGGRFSASCPRQPDTDNESWQAGSNHFWIKDYGCDYEVDPAAFQITEARQKDNNIVIAVTAHDFGSRLDKALRGMLDETWVQAEWKNLPNFLISGMKDLLRNIVLVILSPILSVLY